MTKFNKKDFTYHGGYLHYTGDYEGRPVWPAVSKNGVNVHPSRVGKPKDLFIARFKYGGPFTKAKFMKELMKSFTVEEYVAERNKEGLDSSPLQILRNKNESWYYNLIFAWKNKKTVHCAYDHGP
jgi:hypothetical protein